MDKERSRNLLVNALFVGLLVFAWFNPIYHSALKVLETDLKRVLESLAIVESLYLLARSGASVKLPGIAGVFEAASANLLDAARYLSVSSIAVVVNVMILKLTHFKGFVIVLGVLWLLAFYKRWRQHILRVLIIGLFINPGIGLFTATIQKVDELVHFSKKSVFHEQLSLIHKDYQKKEALRITEQKSRRERQLQRDQKKGRDKLTEFQKAKDKVVETAEKAGDHLVEDFRLTKKAMSFAAKKLRVMTAEFIGAIIVTYLILPLGYLFLVFHTLKYSNRL